MSVMCEERHAEYGVRRALRERAAAGGREAPQPRSAPQQQHEQARRPRRGPRGVEGLCARSAGAQAVLGWGRGQCHAGVLQAGPGTGKGSAGARRQGRWKSGGAPKLLAAGVALASGTTLALCPKHPRQRHWKSGGAA